MRRTFVLAFALLIGTAAAALAHDLFLKLDSYHVPPHSRVSVLVLNGTFGESGGAVARDRVADLSLVSQGRRDRLDVAALEPGDTTLLSLGTGEPGTYVLGLSTRTRRIELSGEDFNRYLALDGIPDVLIERAANKQLDEHARERYSKHVKALLQVGDLRSGDFAAVLGYPAELVPLTNPYDLSPDADLRVRALVDGEPVADQLVIAGGETPEGEAIAEQEVRTGDEGIAGFTIDRPGRWYVKFIHMAPASEPDLEYESKWATLTFEVR